MHSNPFPYRDDMLSELMNLRERCAVLEKENEKLKRDLRRWRGADSMLGWLYNKAIPIAVTVVIIALILFIVIWGFRTSVKNDQACARACSRDYTNKKIVSSAVMARSSVLQCVCFIAGEAPASTYTKE